MSSDRAAPQHTHVTQRLPNASGGVGWGGVGGGVGWGGVGWGGVGWGGEEEEEEEEERLPWSHVR